MNCKVDGVRKNIRYRILTINNQTYILDMGQSFWKLLFPFSYWILPNNVYKVNDNDIITKLKSPEIKQTKTGEQSILAGSFGILVANLLGPMAGYFDIPSTSVVNSVILALVILITLSVCFYINFMNKKSLLSVLNLEKYSAEKLWIKPQSKRHFFFISFFYIFGLGIIILFWGGFIQIANTIILFAGMILMFLILLFSTLTVPVGNTRVEFKDEKYQ